MRTAYDHREVVETPRFPADETEAWEVWVDWESRVSSEATRKNAEFVRDALRRQFPTTVADVQIRRAITSRYLA